MVVVSMLRCNDERAMTCNALVRCVHQELEDRVTEMEAAVRAAEADLHTAMSGGAAHCSYIIPLAPMQLQHTTRANCGG